MDKQAMAAIERALEQGDMAEKMRLLEMVTSAIDAESVSITDTKAERCPYCGSEAIVKRGRYKDDQYWHCKGCNRRFTHNSRKILATTKLPKNTWHRYAQCMIDGLSLRKSAARTGVCLKTSFFMRHRIIECITAYLPGFCVDKGCRAEIDETCVKTSLSGNRGPSFLCPAGREGTAGMDADQEPVRITPVCSRA